LDWIGLDWELSASTEFRNVNALTGEALEDVTFISWFALNRMGSLHVNRSYKSAQEGKEK